MKQQVYIGEGYRIFGYVSAILQCVSCILLEYFFKVINFVYTAYKFSYFIHSLFHFYIFKLCFSTCITCIFIIQSDILVIILYVILHFYTYLTLNLI